MNDMVFKLTQLGFSSYEAKAYFALLQKHPAIGYEVSKISKIPTAKIYETLDKLKTKGAIISSSSEPVLYYPIEPQLLLTRIEKEFVEKIDSLNGQLKEVQSIPNVDITWNLVGYQAVIEKMMSAIKNATEVLLLSLWPQEAAIVKEELVSAEKRGVRVIVGVFGEYNVGCTNTINLESCGASSKERLGMRLTAVVSDSKEVIISEISDREDTLGIWATTPCIILTAKEYIKHDIWGKALIDELGKERFDDMCVRNEILSYLIQNR